MAARKSITIQFTLERETKNTVRYVEDGDADNHKIGALYVKKSAVADLGSPDKLKVVVSA